MSDDDRAYGARIPADIEVPDRVLAGLTARQVAILAVTGLLLWGAHIATRQVIPILVFAALAFPTGAIVAVVALGRRDGLSLDRLLLAAIGQARSPRRLVIAPEGVPAPPGWVDPGRPVPLPAPLRLPAGAISEDGVVDLGGDGVAVVCAASTVSFALRTPAEQAALVGVFARWLNSLNGPTQILVRAEDVDLTPLISGLRDRAPVLPHPALEHAALGHAEFLADLADRRDLLRRQVLIVLREPRTSTPGRGRDTGAAQRVMRRADEAAQALAAAGITLQALTGAQATAVLSACCNPWRPGIAAMPVDGRAAPTDVITGGI